MVRLEMGMCLPGTGEGGHINEVILKRYAAWRCRNVLPPLRSRGYSIGPTELPHLNRADRATSGPSIYYRTYTVYHYQTLD